MAGFDSETLVSMVPCCVLSSAADLTFQPVYCIELKLFERNFFNRRHCIQLKLVLVPFGGNEKREGKKGECRFQ